ncbi:MAG: hypothetical protein FWH41_02875, partial [Treponema sp.]|nr:hypothetical protein [Treponema sp.]
MKKATKSAMVFLSLCAAFLLFSCSADNSIESKDKYTINIVPSANGVVSASAETAEQGKTIILTVIPDSGYRLAPDSLAVIGLEGNLNDAGADADGYKQYSFIMPGDDITVICDFELKPAIVYAVNLAAMQNGTVASSVSEAALGDTVTLTVKPNENFEYTAGSLKVNDGSVTLTAIADDAEGFLRFNFLMPGEIVTVKCSFEEIEVQPQQSYVITVSPSISNGTVYTSPISSKAGSLVAICIKAHEGYAYQESSLKVNGSEEGINFAGELDGELWFLFTMPAEDVNIVCAFYDPTPVYYPINTAGIKSGTVTPDLAEAAENAVVTLTLKPNNNYEYIESSLKINNGAVELTAISDDAQGNKRFTFVMPAENVTVSCTFVYNGPAVDYFSKDYDESITSFSDKFDTSGANHTAGGVNLDKWGFQNGNGSEYGI